MVGGAEDLTTSPDRARLAPISTKHTDEGDDDMAQREARLMATVELAQRCRPQDAEAIYSVAFSDGVTVKDVRVAAGAYRRTWLAALIACGRRFDDGTYLVGDPEGVMLRHHKIVRTMPEDAPTVADDVRAITDEEWADVWAEGYARWDDDTEG